MGRPEAEVGKPAAAAEVSPPILGFPEKFELALRYGENRMSKDVEMSDSDK